MKLSIPLILVGIAGLLLMASVVAWFLWPKQPTTSTSQQSGTLGLDTADTKTVGVSTGQTPGNTNQTQTITTSAASQQKVFKIATGPVTGAAFVQTLNPTTTLARFVLQENGHVSDQPIDVPGSLPRAVSNTTIPGTQTSWWAAKGQVAYLQYLDGGTIKTLSLKFPATTTRVTTQGTQIQFFPDNITALAPSPDGSEAAYLVASASGSDGYVAKSDGSQSKRLFSLPFGELTLSWPAPTTMLLSTKSAANTPGAIFSADRASGSVNPLLYAQGLTAIADRAFANIVYQANVSGKDARYTYIHNIKQNAEAPLSLDPIPEKCAWDSISANTLYCAVPTSYTNASYLDLWHQGAASFSDSIMRYDISTGKSLLVATPGSSDGGEASDIIGLSVSPDDKYLLFVEKGNRSLWAVRLGQN